MAIAGTSAPARAQGSEDASSTIVDDPSTSQPGTRPTGSGDEAADARTRTVARDLALQGAKAFEARDWATALDRFDRAFALFPAPSVGIMRARCLVGLGQWLEALTRYEEVQHAVLSTDASKPLRQAVLDARAEADELRGRIPRLHLSVRLADESGAKNITVKLDGKQVPSVLLGVESPIDPGQHQIVAEAAGYQPETRPIALDARQRLEVEIVLAKTAPTTLGAAPAVDGAPTPSLPEGPPSAGASNATLLGWSAVGVGAVSLGISAVTGLTALQKKSTLDGACTPGCPVSYEDEISSFRSNRNWSYGTLGLGLVATGLGAYLLWQAPGTARIAASLGPGTLGVRGVFQ